MIRNQGLKEKYKMALDDYNKLKEKYADILSEYQKLEKIKNDN